MAKQKRNTNRPHARLGRVQLETMFDQVLLENRTYKDRIASLARQIQDLEQATFAKIFSHCWRYDCNGIHLETDLHKVTDPSSRLTFSRGSVQVSLPLQTLLQSGFRTIDRTFEASEASTRPPVFSAGSSLLSPQFVAWQPRETGHSSSARPDATAPTPQLRPPLPTASGDQTSPPSADPTSAQS